LSDQKTNGPKPSQKEIDRLLFKPPTTPGGRKGISGTEFAGVGVTFSLTIIVFALAGVWLDKRFGTSPVLLLMMVFGGAGLGFRTMYRSMIKKSGKEQ